MITPVIIIGLFAIYSYNLSHCCFLIYPSIFSKPHIVVVIGNDSAVKKCAAGECNLTFENVT